MTNWKKRTVAAFGFLVVAPLFGVTFTVPEPSAEAGGICRWSGTFPFCNGKCDGDIELVRAANGNQAAAWYNRRFAGICRGINQPPPDFGAPCATGTKVLCFPKHP
jgi:hypothetical protein